MTDDDFGEPVARVTVALAAYNAADVVARAIDSVMAQTYSRWEIVAIDDASTDATWDVLDAAARRDRRVRVIRNSTNRGLAASLNLAWRRGEGELVARMDADDISLPTRLERQVRFLDDHPQVAVVGTAARLIDDHGRWLGDAHRPEDHEELARRMYKETPFFHPSVMARRTFLESLGGYDERLRRSQDLDLWLRAYRSFRFHNLQDVLIEYRVPRRLPLEAILWGTFVLARAAYRERLLLTRGWYSLRFLVATLLNRLGLRELRFG